MLVTVLKDNLDTEITAINVQKDIPAMLKQRKKLNASLMKVTVLTDNMDMNITASSVL